MSLHASLGINPVPSGVLTTTQGVTIGIFTKREGVYNLEFPDRGMAGLIPWEQVRQVEVYDDRGEFHLHNGMIGYSYHDPQEVEDRNWYIKVEGMLGLWARQSGVLATLRDGRDVHNLAIPRVAYRCRSKRDAVWRNKDVSRHGVQMIVEERQSLGYHDELWAEIIQIRAQKAAQQINTQKENGNVRQYGYTARRAG